MHSQSCLFALASTYSTAHVCASTHIRQLIIALYAIPGGVPVWPPGWNAGVFDIHAFVVRIRLRAGRAASARVGVSELSLPAMTCSGESFGGRRRGAWWAVLVGFVV